MKLRHGSLFAGIEGFGKGLEDTGGFETVWQVEQEPFCLSVLESRFPNAQRFTDVRTVGKHNLPTVDIITAGVPCQDVSVAGKRAGLSGERTGLFYEFARILQELRPSWFVFENVPGIFSSNNGRDFAEVLRVLMVECGYGVSWRVLNSQYFGVAQRRRRVFIVGSLGRPCPPEILFEFSSGVRNSEASKETREGIAAPLTHGSGVTGNAPGRRREDDINIVVSRDSVPKTAGGCVTDLTDNLQPVGALEAGFGCRGYSGDDAAQGKYVPDQMAVRRLTPTECERLQGFPDGWTIPAGRSEEGADSARYRALGNAVTVQVISWIGARILRAVGQEVA